MGEEIQHVTYDFDGARLQPWQAVHKAGFTDAKLLATGYAVMMGESGRYLKAWHHNVLRNEDDTILRDEQGRMTVRSTDLGFIQKNIAHSPAKVLEMTPEASGALIESLFAANPKLALGDESAKIAWAMFNSKDNTGQKRLWTPWYAWVNGNYKKGLPSACEAVGNFLDFDLNHTDGHRIVRKGA